MSTAQDQGLNEDGLYFQASDDLASVSNVVPLADVCSNSPNFIALLTTVMLGYYRGRQSERR